MPFHVIALNKRILEFETRETSLPLPLNISFKLEHRRLSFLEFVFM